MAQAASKTCEICTRGSGSNYCCDCEQLFCEGCKTAHLRSKVSRNHTFLTGPHIQPKPKVGCHDHKEDYIFYCMPCDTPVCKGCMTDSHNGHEVKSLPAIVSEIKSDLNKQLQIKIATLQSSLSKVKQGTTLFMKDVDCTVKSIQQLGEEVKNAVDKEVEELVNSVRERSNQEMQRLSSVEKDLKSFIDEGNKLQKEYKDASKAKVDIVTLEVQRRLLNDCKNLQTYALWKTPSIKHTKSTLLLQDVTRILGSVSYEEGVLQKLSVDIINVKSKSKKTGDVHIKEKRTSGVKQYKYRCELCCEETSSLSMILGDSCFVIYNLCWNF